MLMNSKYSKHYGRESTKQKQGGAAGHCAVYLPSQHLVARVSASSRPAWARIRPCHKKWKQKVEEEAQNRAPSLHV